MTSIEKSVGQLIMMGLAGPEMSTLEKKTLKKIRPAGIIYFRRNIESPSQLSKLSAHLHRELDRPLIGIDQEGGRVARLAAPFTVFSANSDLGAYYQKTKKLDLVVKKAVAMARELKEVGINLNFTPVVDIHTNPKNPIIGDRAFGSTPGIVAKLAVATIQAYRKEKVISCAKHFPGHGDTHSDSHKVLPTVKTSKKVLFRRELAPFAASIRAGVPTIMTAHVMYPSLDAENPATLSPYILKDILRKKLKYKGVIISDDLEMNAIAKHQKLSEAAIGSLLAGVDLMLVCKSLEESVAIYEAIVKAVETKVLSEKTINSALKRIEKLKKQYIKKKFLIASKPSYDWPKHQGWAQDILTYA